MNLHARSTGLQKVEMDVGKVRSPIAMIDGKYFNEVLVGHHETRKFNFEFAEFRDRYMKEGTGLRNNPDLADDCTEWRRKILYKSGQEVPIICCPEDFQSCKNKHASDVSCGDCAVPLCKKCVIAMAQRPQKAIPMAIANHNFIGYCSRTIVDYRVRWIEAAIVLPVWTTMISYYVEEDRGHLMGEEYLTSYYDFSLCVNIPAFASL